MFATASRSKGQCEDGGRVNEEAPASRAAGDLMTVPPPELGLSPAASRLSDHRLRLGDKAGDLPHARSVAVVDAVAAEVGEGARTTEELDRSGVRASSEVEVDVL